MASPEGPERRKWHVKKEVSVGDLIAFTAAAIAVVTAYNTLDKRLTVLEDRAVQQAANDKRQDDDSIRYQKRIDDTLAKMDSKLDRLIERRP